MNLNWRKEVGSDVDLDRELNSSAQCEVARLVRELPEDMPSMAWRSNLNEKLRFEAAKIRRKRLVTNWVFRPALGFGLAASAALFMLNTSTPKPVTHVDKGGDVAEAIVRIYSDEIQNRDVMFATFNSEVTTPQKPQADNTTDPYAEDVIDSI